MARRSSAVLRRSASGPSWRVPFSVWGRIPRSSESAILLPLTAVAANSGSARSSQVPDNNLTCLVPTAMANHQKRSSGRQPADSTVAEAPQDLNPGTETADAASSASPATTAPEGGRQAKAPSLNINDLK